MSVWLIPISTLSQPFISVKSVDLTPHAHNCWRPAYPRFTGRPCPASSCAASSPTKRPGPFWAGSRLCRSPKDSSTQSTFSGTSNKPSANLLPGILNSYPLTGPVHGCILIFYIDCTFIYNGAVLSGHILDARADYAFGSRVSPGTGLAVICRVRITSEP